MPDELPEGLRRCHTGAFPLRRSRFRMLVDDGQRPTTQFIGGSDSRLVPGEFSLDASGMRLAG